MKIEIDISDFYIEEGEFTDALKEYVTTKAITEINKKTDTFIQAEVQRRVKEMVESELHKRTEIELKRLMSEGQIKNPDPYQKDKTMVSFEEYIKIKFEASGNYNSINDQIKSVAENFAKQARQKYDLLFASQVVAKMKDSGFLNEDGVKLLIEKP